MPDFKDGHWEYRIKTSVGGDMSAVDNKASMAVERTILILEAIAQRAAGMTNAEISRRLAIPKSTASYILRALERSRYVNRERQTGKYRLGLKLLALGRGVQIGLEIKESARPFLERLVQQSGLTAHIAMLDHREAVYIDKVEAPGLIRLDTWIGRRMDLHSTSVGKVLAAFMFPAELDASIKERGLKQRTARTITTSGRLIKELSRVRDAGYAVDDEENSPGVRCLAAPIRDAQGRVRAALGLSGTTMQIDKRSIKSICRLVVEASAEISGELGYRTGPRSKPGV
jgi:IclR family KDG regulon transcriptional repressor